MILTLHARVGVPFSFKGNNPLKKCRDKENFARIRGCRDKGTRTMSEDPYKMSVEVEEQFSKL